MNCVDSGSLFSPVIFCISGLHFWSNRLNLKNRETIVASGFVANIGGKIEIILTNLNVPILCFE